LIFNPGTVLFMQKYGTRVVVRFIVYMFMGRHIIIEINLGGMN